MMQKVNQQVIGLKSGRMRDTLKPERQDAVKAHYFTGVLYYNHNPDTHC
jgi:hypothetical protein